jgi:hypothetical protein
MKLGLNRRNWKFAALLGLLMSAAAQAQTAAPEPQATVPADSKEPIVVAAPAVKEAPKAHCLTSTGTRIVRRDKNACMGDPGRTYTREDIARTGAIDIGDALMKLDPSITVHR